VEGWLDLAKLVASEGSKSKSPYEELAYKIGEQLFLPSTAQHPAHSPAWETCVAHSTQLLLHNCNAQAGMCMWTLLAGTCS
jgi:hypothetical protein